MSAPHHYHQPNAPDSPIDDDDSDLDIDLHELDPQPSSHLTTAQPRSYSTSPSYNLADLANRIPLRNLRAARQRHRTRQEDEDEDVEGLLEDGDAAASRERDRDSGGSCDSAHDGAPLLSGSHGSANPAREPRARQTSLQKIASTLRRPAFSRPVALPSEGRDEAEEENDASTNRTILVLTKQPTRYPPNTISNAKYTPLSFLPLTLWNEFKFFLNLYFLLVALSQILPQLRIGYLSTYVAPLAFVLVITLGKEALDDMARRRRDAEANSETFTTIEVGGQAAAKKRRRRRKGGTLEDADGVREVVKPSRDLKVGDVLKLGKNQRIPADVVILKSVSMDTSGSAETEAGTQEMAETSLIETEDQDSSAAKPVATNQLEDTASAGEAFIRTDQLDGETDWKLRLPSALSQRLDWKHLARLQITAAKPDRKVNEFVGTMELPSANTEEPQRAALSIDNTAWANTVLASSTTVYAVIVYTGSQTRAALSTSSSRSKTGLLELELNTLTKILCALTLTLSGVLVLIGRIENPSNREWYISVMRFLILFSTVVPISLRVNLDMGKSVYAWFIEHDKSMPGVVARTSTIPEDLGRIEYLLSDKTGTLTSNEMELKKVHVGTVSYANEAMDEVSAYISQSFSSAEDGEGLVTPSTPFTIPATSTTRTRREIGSRVRDLVMALAICHNVTPTSEEVDGETVTSYQASSPDEIAIVKWTENVGLRLVHRDRHGMTLASLKSGKVVVKVRILNVFPFTSETKRMGIIVKFETGAETQGSGDDELWFYEKGADTVMMSIVAANDWLDEETANMAREGLRTLVVGRRKLSSQAYSSFQQAYHQASLSLQSRDVAMTLAIKDFLERDLELLGVTGVEDKLQVDVKPSLELLRNAGIKIWMLTGDKVETARCVAISAKLVSRGQTIITVEKVKRKDAAYDALNSLRGKTDACLLIDGESLSTMLTHLRLDFIALAVQLPAVIACRCSPTQKAQLALLIRSHTKKRVACIGDGGNDVSMIQAADVGVGIVGKEGRQASLAADFSILRFCDLTKLLVWHGRNSYKRSAKLGQFVMHRGLIISVCQTVFSIAGGFEPNALYRVSIFFPTSLKLDLLTQVSGLAPSRLRNPLHSPPRLFPCPR